MITRILRRLFRRGRPQTRSLAETDAAHVAALRAKGVQIGAQCRIYTDAFSTEPWLVRIGDNVGIAGGVKFLTHDGSAALLRGTRPMAQRLGTITIGNGVFIGENAILLPGVRIGDGCIVAPGSVVRGQIPPNSLVVGNPATVAGRASLLLARMMRDPDTLDTFGLDEPTRRRVIEDHFREPSR